MKGTGFGPLEFLYRHRGWVAVLPIAGALAAADPKPVPLVAGLILMAAGEGIRLWSAAHLGQTARSSRPRAAKLVTGGPYARTRHPLYWGNFALTAGFALATGAGFPWFPAVVAAGFFVLYAGYARREETVLARAFPDAHAAYRSRVPGFGWRAIPAAVPGVGDTTPPTWRRALRVERWTLNAELWLGVLLWLRTHWPGGG